MSKKVKVKTLSGPEIELDYDEDTLILHLKQKISENHPLKPIIKFQKLICSGKLAVNTQKVSDFVANSDVIHLIYVEQKDDSSSSSKSKTKEGEIKKIEEKEQEIKEKEEREAKEQMEKLKKENEKLSKLKDAESRRLVKLREKILQNYLLQQQLDNYHLQETIAFMKYKGIDKHPVLKYDENVLRKRNVKNLIRNLNLLSNESSGEEGDDSSPGSSPRSDTTSADQNQAQNAPAAVNAANAADAAAAPAPAPVPQNNPQPAAPPAADPEQFDIIDRMFSLLQIVLFLGMMYFRSSSANLYYFAGAVVVFFLFKLWRNGFLRPGRRNDRAGAGNNAAGNNAENGQPGTGENRPRAPPGFMRVLGTFVYSFVRSLIPEQLPPGVVVE